MKPDEEYTFLSVTTRNKTGLYRNKQRNKYPARYRPTYKNKAKAGYQEQEGIENDGCGKKSKPAYGQPIDRQSYEQTVCIFEQLLQLLHPFMPFITEDIWQALRTRKDGESIMISIMPQLAEYDENLLSRFEAVKNVIVGIRNIRKQDNVPFKDALELKVKVSERYLASFASIICKMGNISIIETVTEAVKGARSFIADTVEYFIPASGQVDTVELRAKLKEDLKYTQGFLASVMKKLSNEKFVNGAPAQVVANERKKQADAEAKIAAIEAQLKEL